MKNDYTMLDLKSFGVLALSGLAIEAVIFASEYARYQRRRIARCSRDERLAQPCLGGG
jgi:hypothetical protein